MKIKLCLRHFLIFPLVFFFTSCFASRPDTLGVTEGLFAVCPDSPNCVSTQAKKSDSEHRMEPIVYNGEASLIHQKIITTLESMERMTLITSEEFYIHAEFRSKIMRFVDDVEFYIDDEQKLIHFRSASRLGYSDMGVNRDRMNTFIELYNKTK